MGVTHAPITLQFAEQTITILVPPQSSDCLPAHLRRHFAGCLAENGDAAAVFRLKLLPDNQWQLWQGDSLLLQAETATCLLEPLMQAILEQLIAPVAAHLVFHAGGMALEGRGALLCAPSGSGKSTLTARLLQEGFDYLSDEVVAVPLSLDGMQGFARSLVLKAGSAFVWRNGPASNEALPLPGGLAWVTPAYLGGERCPQAAPRLLLFPQFEAGSDLAITPLSAGQAAFALLQNLANARNLPEQGFRLTAALARRVPAFRVTYGEETAVAHWLYEKLGDR